jgi:Zn-dependent protease
VDSQPSAGLALRHHPLGAMRAVAIGEVVLSREAPTDARLVAHELCHVAQARRWGVLFGLAYLWASLRAVMRGQDAYQDNVFEVQARAAEVLVGHTGD